jgi:hypothetical protein
MSELVGDPPWQTEAGVPEAADPAAGGLPRRPEGGQGDGHRGLLRSHHAAPLAERAHVAAHGLERDVQGFCPAPRKPLTPY